MSNKKPVTVTITRGKRGFIFDIDKPGPARGQTKAKDGKPKEYSTAWSAWRGALRQLVAFPTWHTETNVIVRWEADCGPRFGWREVIRVNA